MVVVQGGEWWRCLKCCPINIDCKTTMKIPIRLATVINQIAKGNKERNRYVIQSILVSLKLLYQFIFIHLQRQNDSNSDACICSRISL